MFRAAEVEVDQLFPLSKLGVESGQELEDVGVSGL